MYAVYTRIKENTMPTYYAGIGSRSTPKDICAVMTYIAASLEDWGYTLRSGHADGADIAFEKGVVDPLHKEIYLPFAGFNGSPSSLHHISEEALALAAHFHPRWAACNRSGRLLHARNCYQILGEDFKTPAKFVVCWTPDGSTGVTSLDTGGTGQALRIAHAHGIKIYNIQDPVVLRALLTKIDQTKAAAAAPKTPPILEFQGEYRFLSNFWPTQITLGPHTFASVEHAYQASKCLDPRDRTAFLGITAGEAKRLGRTVAVRSDWEHHKVQIMTSLVRAKFQQEPLRSQLLATGTADIAEGNRWGDTYWGVSLLTMEGENRLGQILMQVRKELATTTH